MKKINVKMLSAFVSRKNAKLGNTEVFSFSDYTKVYLFGNEIASYNWSLKILTIYHCGWTTNTTKDRLNAILYLLNLGRICQDKFVWYYENENKRKLFNCPFSFKCSNIKFELI